MMNFRVIKESLIDNVLVPNQGSKFRTIGNQKQARSAEDAKGLNRTVQVYYVRGAFDKSHGTLNGPSDHDITFKIDFMVSAAAEVDLSVINDEDSSSSEIATAIAAYQEASGLADDSLDELFELVYQIIMDGQYYDLGLAKGIVSNRFIGELQKDDPVERGEFVTLTGSASLTCRTSEIASGITGIAATDIDSTVQINQDDKTKAGVTNVF